MSKPDRVLEPTTAKDRSQIKASDRKTVPNTITILSTRA